MSAHTSTYTISDDAAEGKEDGYFGEIFTPSFGPLVTPRDRAVVVPRVHRSSAACLLCLFDGTVGTTAVDAAAAAVPREIANHTSFREALRIAESDPSLFLLPSVSERVRVALHHGFERADESVLSVCASVSAHYSACTGVAVVLCGNLLSVAHIGDSKAVLVRVIDDEVDAAELTLDHKPNQDAERARIESCGGSVAFLRHGRPFLRGGDFMERQARNEHPMQLNYSRAFGGKDLKPFGLIATPDILQLELVSVDRLVIIASDGLWDVINARDAGARAWRAICAGDDPAATLTQCALAEHDARGSCDNVTVIVAMLP